jgi:hypothetical protein
VVERPLGIGALADTLHLTLQWDGEGPATAVLKLPAEDDLARATAATLGAYEREARFYLDLAPHLGIRVPRCYGVLEFDGVPQGILLEDLSTTHRGGDQFSDLDPTILRLARQQLVRMQGPVWDDPVTASLPWLHRRLGVPIPELHARMARSWRDGGRDAIGSAMTPAQREFVDWFIPRAESWSLGLSGPMTLVHHDFRVDNMLFGARPDDLVVIDFQTVGWGVPMFDVAYLMGTSLGPEPRRALERDEIARHADELGEHGVHLEAAAAWDLYRQASVAVLVMLVSASGSVKSSERSLAMYRRLLASGAQMALDLDAAEFIGG